MMKLSIFLAITTAVQAQSYLSYLQVQLFNSGNITQPPQQIFADGAIKLITNGINFSPPLQYVGYKYTGNGDGCVTNSTAIYPNETAGALILAQGGCDLSLKVSLLQSLGYQALVLYSKESDNNYFNMNYNASIPIMLADYTTGTYMASLFELQALTDPSLQPERLKVTMATQEAQLSAYGIIEFILVVVVILLAFSFMASVCMHAHLYRMRRNFEAAAAEQQVEQQQKSVLTKEELDSLPLRAFKSQETLRRSSEPIIQGPSSLSRVPSRAHSLQSIHTTIHSLDHHDNFTTMCAICIEDYQDGEMLRQLPCQHMFHPHCIQEWLCNKNGVCPLCKEDVTTSFVQSRRNSLVEVPQASTPIWRRSIGVRWLSAQRQPDVEMGRVVQ